MANCYKIEGMTMRVQHVDGEYRVVLSAEVVEALHLTDGAEVEVRPVGSEGVASASSVHEYVSVAEALESYARTEPLHRNTYRELAK